MRARDKIKLVSLYKDREYYTAKFEQEQEFLREENRRSSANYRNLRYQLERVEQSIMLLEKKQVQVVDRTAKSYAEELFRRENNLAAAQRQHAKIQDDVRNNKYGIRGVDQKALTEANRQLGLLNIKIANYKRALEFWQENRANHNARIHDRAATTVSNAGVKQVEKTFKGFEFLSDPNYDPIKTAAGATIVQNNASISMLSQIIEPLTAEELDLANQDLGEVLVDDWSIPLTEVENKGE